MDDYWFLPIVGVSFVYEVYAMLTVRTNQILRMATYSVNPSMRLDPFGTVVVGSWNTAEGLKNLANHIATTITCIGARLFWYLISFFHSSDEQ